MSRPRDAWPASGSRDRSGVAERASLLERLIDGDPGAHADMFRRDLEAVLNDNPCVSGWPNGTPELAYSLVNFGIPDLNVVNLATEQARDEAMAAIAAAISRWEPRLRHVRVRVMPPVNTADRALHLRICARAGGAATAAMTFDGVLDPLSHDIRLMQVGCQDDERPPDHAAP